MKQPSKPRPEVIPEGSVQLALRFAGDGRAAETPVRGGKKPSQEKPRRRSIHDV
jgi:hypothetical protein